MPRHDIERGYMVIALGRYPAIYEESEFELARDNAIRNLATLHHFERVEDYQ